MEHKKDFVQSIRGKITDRPAEQEILRMQEDIANILDAELAFILQSQHLQEERTSNRRLQAIKTLDASFELFFFFRFRFAVASAFQQDLIPLCICQQILQKWLCFAFLVINICLEGNIYPIHRRYSLLFDAKIISDEGTDIVAGAAFNVVPIVFIIDVLELCWQPHKNEVADFIAFAEGHTG